MANRHVSQSRLFSNRQSAIENLKCIKSIVAIFIGCPERRDGDRGEYINQLTRESEFGNRYDERIAGGRCSLRPPGPSLEPEDEGIHLWRAQRHLHYRSAKNPEDVSRSTSVRH